MTMTTNQERQYETAARYMDGEKVPLDTEEEAIVKDYSDDEKAVNPKLDAEMSSRESRRIRKKVHVLVRNLPRRTLRAFIIGLIVAIAFLLILWSLKYFKQGRRFNDDAGNQGIEHRTGKANIDNVD